MLPLKGGMSSFIPGGCPGYGDTIKMGGINPFSGPDTILHDFLLDNAPS